MWRRLARTIGCVAEHSRSSRATAFEPGDAVCYPDSGSNHHADPRADADDTGSVNAGADCEYALT
jgi:hypothetical protein